MRTPRCGNDPARGRPRRQPGQRGIGAAKAQRRRSRKRPRTASVSCGDSLTPLVPGHPFSHTEAASRGHRVHQPSSAASAALKSSSLASQSSPAPHLWLCQVVTPVAWSLASAPCRCRLFVRQRPVAGHRAKACVARHRPSSLPAVLAGTTPLCPRRVSQWGPTSPPGMGVPFFLNQRRTPCPLSP